MRMWYTGIQREHDAGVIEVGQFVTPIMVIPPNAKNFTATGIANGECTSEVRCRYIQTFCTLSLIYSSSLKAVFMCLQMHFIHMKLVSCLCLRENWLVTCTSHAGHGLTLQHIRYNTDCDVYEELEPIDRNLQYDFNFQQINHLRREIVIMPVS